MKWVFAPARFFFFWWAVFSPSALFPPAFFAPHQGKVKEGHLNWGGARKEGGTLELGFCASPIFFLVFFPSLAMNWAVFSPLSVDWRLRNERG